MLELGQIQSNVLREYRRGEAPKLVRYVFLHFADRVEARALVGSLLDHVTSCADVDRGELRWVLNIGLTYSAVELFGFGGNARALDDRDHEATGAIEAFKCGMKERATKILGDDLESDPKYWEPVYREDRIHAVLSLSAHDAPGMDELVQLVELRLAAHPTVERLHDEVGQDFGGEHTGQEHFGFADGIGQPAVLHSGLGAYPGEGSARKRRGWTALQPGEFVLGYTDESGQIQFRSGLFKNGSFLVFRKLRQHVGRFRAYVSALAERKGLDPELVAAKMVGRWRSGAPLVLSPKRDDAELGADPHRNNDFRYDDDPEGTACPVGAHIRRNNPREDPSGPGVVQTRLHRIIRRGTPYGPWLEEGREDDGVDRGLLFVAINADISRQFEFIQQNWVNSVLSSTKLTLPADRDPVMGHQWPDDQPGKLVIPSTSRRQAPVIAWELPRFVTTRGGAYFLLPSLDTLYDIAHDIRPPDEDEGCGDGDEEVAASNEADYGWEPEAKPADDGGTGPSEDDGGDDGEGPAADTDGDPAADTDGDPAADGREAPDPATPDDGRPPGPTTIVTPDSEP